MWFQKMQTPWKAIWTSLPFISLIIAHCGQNWGFWTLMTEMPSYMKQVLGVDIKAVKNISYYSTQSQAKVNFNKLTCKTIVSGLNHDAGLY